ncbi:endonuclease/exonuclease/phosphatase family protein [Plantactinospora sp. GCM10030261]|uniref:endonuclease/exonuclease/phosphatase family protein n=1 Tax=Plantactinospora sp. GCM10030261 TaxID=3273420 RepID=UPI00360D595E
MADDRTVLRLLTFNTLFKGDVRARLRALGAILDRERYDVVCLQEVMYRRNADLLRRLARSCPHHAYRGAVLLHGGLVLLSRWPVRQHRWVRFPALRPIRPELLMRKGAQVATLGVPGGGLAVVNTHLSANLDDDWSPENRYTRIERAELTRLAGALSTLDPALPVVVAGDFNLPRGSAPLHEFAAATGLRDVLAADTEPTYRPTPSWPAPPALDHVLVRSAAGRTVTARARLVLREAEPLADGRRAYLSDHFGIETELTLSGGYQAGGDKRPG